MGYYTNFTGSVNIDPPLSEEMESYLKRFFNTRHYIRDKTKILDALNIYGLSMESFTPPGTSDCGSNGELFAADYNKPAMDRYGHDVYFNNDEIDYNRPPTEIPSLWCGFELKGKDTLVLLDGKNYEYVAWLEFLINKLLKPRGYTLNGYIEFDGEDDDDNGCIQITDNVVVVHYNE